MTMSVPFAIFLTVPLMLVSCGTTQSVGHYKVGEPYTVDGKIYVPGEDPDYDEIGIASWYGEPFDGQETANGEIFKADQFSAAHKTLPLPSYVKVTNLDNQKSMIIRVNDRGPFVRGRILDVSEAAARQLGFHKEGKALVRVQFLPKQSLQAARQAIIYEEWRRGGDPLKTDFKPTVSRQGDIYVQAGAYRRQRSINNLVNALEDAQLPVGEPIIDRVTIGGDDVFRLRFGPFAGQSDAINFRQWLQEKGVPDAYIVVR